MLKRIPLSKLNKSWNKIEWMIKWSEYGIDGNIKDADPGVIKSLGWVRLLINGKMYVDERLPVGNNAQGRVPYFKLGL